MTPRLDIVLIALKYFTPSRAIDCQRIAQPPERGIVANEIRPLFHMQVIRVHNVNRDVVGVK